MYFNIWIDNQYIGSKYYYLMLPINSLFIFRISSKYLVNLKILFYYRYLIDFSLEL
jgi:hypothetical protein